MRTAVRARSVLRDVAFSGCGWLSPFHLGAWSHLQSVGLVDRTTRLLGASGGALIAAGISLDLEPKALMGHLLGLSAWARSNGIIRGNLEGELRVRIGEILPDDAAERATRRELGVCVVPADPRQRLKQRIIRSFHNKQDLEDALITSSYVPLYLSRGLATQFRGEWCLDGGIGDILPPTPEVCVNITPYFNTRRGSTPTPSIPLLTLTTRGDITPDWLPESERPVSLPTQMKHTFFPGSDDDLLMYYDLGESSARAWEAATYSDEE